MVENSSIFPPYYHLATTLFQQSGEQVQATSGPFFRQPFKAIQSQGIMIGLLHRRDTTIRLFKKLDPLHLVGAKIQHHLAADRLVHSDITSIVILRVIDGFGITRHVHPPEFIIAEDGFNVLAFDLIEKLPVRDINNKGISMQKDPVNLFIAQPHINGIGAKLGRIRPQYGDYRRTQKGSHPCDKSPNH